MREFLPALAGNRALRARLGEELAAGAFSHAYILEGPRGIGKRTLAKQAAMAAACQRRGDANAPLPCVVCEHCRKIREGLSPDFITVRREEGKATMGVDVIRALRTDIAVVPNDLDLKIYIIEDAHTMTVQAQNAFLLTLEEPPAFVLFFLLSQDAGALLETVRSRAPVLRLCPVTDAEAKAYLLGPDAPHRAEAAQLAAQDPAAFEAILKIADGRIGVAEELLDAERREPLFRYREVAAAICSLTAGHTGRDELLSLFLGVGNAREDALSQIAFLEPALRDLILLCQSENAPLCFFTDREEALDLSARFTAARLFSMYAAAEETREALLANANVRLSMIQLMQRLIQRE